MVRVLNSLFNSFKTGFQVLQAFLKKIFTFIMCLVSVIFILGSVLGFLFKVVSFGGKALCIVITAANFGGDLMLRTPLVFVKAMFYILKIILFFSFWAGGFVFIRLYHDPEARQSLAGVLESAIVDWVAPDVDDSGILSQAARWVLRQTIRLGVDHLADALRLMIGVRAVRILDGEGVVSRRLVDAVYFVLDSGCTNHVLTCPPLKGDTKVGGLTLGLASGMQAPGERYASSEIHVEQGENLLSLDRICDAKLGSRVALVTDRTTRLTPLTNAGGGDEYDTAVAQAVKTLSDVMDQHPSTISAKSNHRTTIVSESDAFVLRQESREDGARARVEPFEAQHGRMGTVRTPSSRYFGHQHQCDHFDHLWQKWGFEFEVHRQRTTRAHRETLWELWQECKRQPRSFCKTVEHMFPLPVATEHDDDIDPELELSFADTDEVFAARGKIANLERAPRKKDSSRRVPLSKARTTVFCDVLHATVPSYDGCEYAFVFDLAKPHAVDSNKEQDVDDDEEVGSEEPMAEFTHVTLAFPTRGCDASDFMTGWAVARTMFGLAGPSDFDFVVEHEGFLSVAVLEQLALSGARVMTTLAGTSPWQEVFVKKTLNRARALLHSKHLPSTMWSGAMELLNEVEAENAKLVRTSSLSSTELLEAFGTLIYFKLGKNLGYEDKMQPRGTPALVAGVCKHPTGIRVVRGRSQTDPKLGFVRSDCDFRGCHKTGELVFRTEREGLHLQKFLHDKLVKFATETRKLTKSQVKCEKCLVELGEPRSGPGRPPAHTYDSGCKLRKTNYLIPSDLDHVKNVDFKEVKNEVVVRFLAAEQELARRLQQKYPIPFESDEAQLTVEEEKRLAQQRFVFARRLKLFEQLHPALRGEMSGKAFAAVSRHVQPLLKEHLARMVRDQHAGKQESIHAFAVVYNIHELKSELSDPELRELWQAGLDREICNLIQRGILAIRRWEHVGPEDEVIPSLLVMSVKSDGRRKFRLTACGNHQVKPDGAELYAEVVSHQAASSVLRLAASLGWTIGISDVSEAFTQSDPKNASTRTFLRMPSAFKHLMSKALTDEGYSVQDLPKLLFEVKASIYGERDAPAVWLATLTKWMLETMGFTQSSYDASVFVHPAKELMILVYVDDIICVGREVVDVQEFFDSLHKRFRCTPVEWLKRGETYRRTEADEPLTFLTDRFFFSKGDNGQWYFNVSQEGYVKSAAEKLVAKGVLTADELAKPLQQLSEAHFSHAWLSAEDSSNPVMSQDELRLLRTGVNTLSYCSQRTRPELAAALGALARGQSSTGRQRFLVALRELVRYAFTHSDRHLSFPTSDKSKSIEGMFLRLEADADASLGSEKDGPFARHGYTMSMRLGFGDPPTVVSGQPPAVLCFWRTGLQKTISLSSAESEITCASWTTRELLAQHNFWLQIAGRWGSTFYVAKPWLYQDNEASEAACNGGGIRKLRHLTLAQLFVRTSSAAGRISVLPKRTQVMTGDIMTKVLGEQVLQRLLKLLGFKSRGGGP